jgi:diguanylate cyclase (GGDEF)-like protein
VAKQSAAASALPWARAVRSGRRDLRLPAFLTLTNVLGLPALLATIVFAFRANGSARPILCLALGAVLVAGEMLPIPVARGDDAGDEVSISSTIALALAMLAPAGVAVLAQTVALVADEVRSRRMWYRLPFNVAQYALAIICSRLVFDLVTGTHMNVWYPTLPQRVLAGGLLGGVAFYVVNNGLIGVAVALKLRLPIRHQVFEDFRHQVVTSGVLLALAPVTAIAVSSHPWSLPLIMLPLAAVHRSARMAYAREHEALHDSLTGLANRALFNARLERAHREQLPSTAVLLIDVDHFKEINDTLGHHAGDIMLVELAKRLRSVVRERDLVARLGGDEFAVLINSAASDEELERLVERLRDGLHQPVNLNGVRIDTSASVGVVLATDEDSAEALLRRADVAMYAAKRSRGTVAYYRAEHDGHSVERLSLLGELREAAEQGQIFFVYQPKISLTDGSIVGVEALARWQHPTFGELSPMRFIPLAESTGLIDTMTKRLLEHGLDQLAAWHGNDAQVGLAVNISARSLGDERFVDEVHQMLLDRAITPGLLTLEVTESSIMTDFDQSTRVLRQLRNLGVRISIDDFGTGYSSLAYLKRIFADELKIDKSFVQRVADDTQDEVIVGMTIQLGHELGLSVVAEGVETDAAAEILRRLGCDAIQGYLIAAPMTAVEMTDWLQTRDIMAVAEAS